MTNSAGRRRKTLTRTPVTRAKGAAGKLSADLKRSGVLPTVDKGRVVPPRRGKAPTRRKAS